MKQQGLSRHVEAMEPLMPAASGGVLSDLTLDIYKACGTLSGRHIPQRTRRNISAIVRQMNSYYSNLIEGHRTSPKDVEDALNQRYSHSPKKKALQQLGVAHIQCEDIISELLEKEPGTNIYAPGFSKLIHREFYSRVPEEFRVVKSVSGKDYPLTPGEFRTCNVDIGNHTGPDLDAVNSFADRLNLFYGSDRIQSSRRLVAIAAFHHRFLWVHPFGDGNGRVARLLSHAAILQSDLDGFGLWTLSRGLARQQNDYYQYLSLADEQRYNDYDGRGNLSDKGLAQFCVFFLEVILDQIRFMSSVLEYDGLKHRIENYIYRNDIFAKYNDQGKYLLFEALERGELPRGEAARITGYGETVAREILQQALDAGLLQADGPRSPVYLGFPQEVREDYFPKLFMPSSSD